MVLMDTELIKWIISLAGLAIIIIMLVKKEKRIGVQMKNSDYDPKKIKGSISLREDDYTKAIREGFLLVKDKKIWVEGDWVYLDQDKNCVIACVEKVFQSGEFYIIVMSVPKVYE